MAAGKVDASLTIADPPWAPLGMGSFGPATSQWSDFGHATRSRATNTSEIGQSALHAPKHTFTRILQLLQPSERPWAAPRSASVMRAGWSRGQIANPNALSSKFFQLQIFSRAAFLRSDILLLAPTITARRRLGLLLSGWMTPM